MLWVVLDSRQWVLSDALCERIRLSRRLLSDRDRDPGIVGLADDFAVEPSALGERERVRQLSQDSLSRYRRVLGDDHLDTLVAAHDLAVDLRASGEPEQARALDEDTLSRRRRVLGAG
jgi:Tetratricopeptide repeat